MKMLKEKSGRKQKSFYNDPNNKDFKRDKTKKLQVFGAITPYGKSKLIIWEGNQNETVYIENLKKIKDSLNKIWLKRKIQNWYF